MGTFNNRRCVEPASMAINSSTSLGWTQVSVYFISLGILNDYDALQYIGVEFSGSGDGSYALSMIVRDIAPMQEAIAEPLTVRNLSVNNVQSSILNVQSYTTQTSPQANIGYVNGSWATPTGTYGLPIIATHPTAVLATNFSYTEEATNKAACIGMILRSDYSNGTFTDPSLYPTMQVQVCSWWSVTLPINGSIGDVTLDTTYELCNQTLSSSDRHVSWQSYLFISSKNSLAVSNLDLMQFLRYIHGKVESLSAYYLAGVTFSLWIELGSGTFIWELDAQLTPPIIACPFSNYSNRTQ